MLIAAFVLVMLSIVMLRIHVFDDERKAIEEVIATLNHNNVQLVHIERLEPRKAIAFYRYDDVLGQGYFGHLLLEKGWFGWNFASNNYGSSSYADSKKYKIT